MSEGAITLQINLAPSDAHVARHLLPHQLQTFATAVDRIILTVDRSGGGGKFADRPDGPDLETIIERSTNGLSHVSVESVRYDSAARDRVSEVFFGGRSYGLQDRRGGPCHCYLDAFLSVDTKYLLHMDSDMMFSGDGGAWLGQARSALDDPRIIAVNPLGGPPGPPDKYQRSRNPERHPDGFLFDELSTRLLFVDVAEFVDRLCPLPAADKFPASQQLERWLGRHPRQELPEILMSKSMSSRGLKRLDMLGSGPGLWALHPIHKTPQLAALLPEILSRVESGDVPDEQRGHYDLHPSLAPLGDLPGLRTKVRRWLTRSPAQPSEISP